MYLWLNEFNTVSPWNILQLRNTAPSECGYLELLESLDALMSKTSPVLNAEPARQ
jgi:hypothetical protein